MRLGLPLLALLALLGLGAVADAQQLEFKRTILTDDERLSYGWRDHEQREFSTVFMLTRQVVRTAESSFRDFSLEAMWRVIEADMHEEIDRSARGARVTLRRSGNSIGWNIEARDQSTADVLGRRLTERLDASRAAYLARHLRRRVDERRIMVDFAGATRTLQEPMRPLARALGEDRGIASTDTAPGWPMRWPSSRTSPTPCWRTPPARAVISCPGRRCSPRTAVTATARPWRLPRCCGPTRRPANSRSSPCPGQAILAVDLSPEPGDRQIHASGRVAGTSLVALEAAGPVLIPVGRIGPDTERLLGARDVQIWPLN